MATIFEAFTDGWRRVLRAPAILFGVFLVTLLMALPAASAIGNSIAGGLGSSLDGGAMADGVDADWWARFGDAAKGLDRTFTRSVIGFTAVVDNLSRFLDGEGPDLALAGLTAAHLVLWLFLVGGILDRYARMRPTRSRAFFGACGTYFFRFLRLALVGAAGYWLLFGLLHGWLFEDLYGWANRDLTVERTAFALRAALYAVFLALLGFWNVVMDYAKIRTVVEDRISMLGAVLAGWRFVVRHPMKTFGLYLLNAAAFLGVVLLYAVAAPGAAGAGALAWWAFVIGQVYLLARLAVKLAFYASQTALFQRSLAHLAYTAAPDPIWPESPSAEAIANAARH